MEEVWNDMNLSSLHDHRAPSNAADYRSVIFQDFLARSPYDSPSSQDISSSSLSPASPLVTALSLGAAAAAAPPPFPSFLDPLPAPAPHPHSHPSNLPSLTPNHPFRFKRHFPDSSPNDPYNNPLLYNVNNLSDSSGNGNDRHMRMIKNRESAARSRARKQEKTPFLAYTNELEQKVEYLTNENERLRKQQQEMSNASASDKKKNPLFRTSTAPF